MAKRDSGKFKDVKSYGSVKGRRETYGHSEFKSWSREIADVAKGYFAPVRSVARTVVDQFSDSDKGHGYKRRAG